ncbi:MAG: substrate-binding periplasmic protein [Thermodesulfobacteriota bacterium]
MKHFVAVLIVIAGICSMNIAGFGADDDCQKIVVSSDEAYPPISWRDKEHPEKIIGVAIELIEMAFADLGISVESRYVGPWKRTLKMLELGEIDMISGLYITEERKAAFQFVFPMFMTDPSVIFVKKGAAFSFDKWDDLKGLTGGSRFGDSYGEQFDAFAKKNLTIEQVTTFKMLYKKIEYGRNRYMIYGLYPGWAQAEELGVRDKIEYLPNFISNEGVYVAFSKRSPCARHGEFLGKKIQEYIAARLPEKLVEKYVTIWKDQAIIPSMK